MNEKEIAEIRRRFRHEKSNISRVCGCFVNEKKEIISEFDQSLGLMSEEENDEMLSLLRKVLTGGLGKNLCDVEFSTQQVLEAEEHKVLMRLRDSGLSDKEAVHALYERICTCLEMEGNYLIILAQDRYDVPKYLKDGEKSEDAGEVFRYLICAVCSVKVPKPVLSYMIHGGQFRNVSIESSIASPALGFMFPTFDDRTANIYKALYYSKDTHDNHPEFVDGVFGLQVPMAADVQKETFCSVLEETVGEHCNLRVMRSIHQQVSEMIVEHKENREEDPLLLDKQTVTRILEHGGVNEACISAFEQKYDEAFGASAQITPTNVVSTKRFEVRTPDVVIQVNPERSDLVKTRVIDGVKYIMICADEDVQVNGVSIQIRENP